MSFFYSPRLEDAKLESLQTQLDYLNLLRLRHQQWMGSTDDPDVKEFHLKIAKELEEVTASYGSLLNTLQGVRSLH